MMVYEFVKATRQDAGRAERAAEHFAKKKLACVETRRVCKTRFNKVDFFGADIVGKQIDGSHVYIQVTSGQGSAVSARKRKLEPHIWHSSDRVYLLRMVKYKIEEKRLVYEFHIYEYIHHTAPITWTTPYIIVINREWFRALNGKANRKTE